MRCSAFVVLAFSSALCAAQTPLEHAETGDAPQRPGIELPDGKGRNLVETACTSCHDLAGIAAFKGYWNRERWAAMVATMIEHGAKLDEAEARTVVEYLTAHFGRVDESEPEGE